MNPEPGISDILNWVFRDGAWKYLLALAAAVMLVVNTHQGGKPG